MFVAVVCCLQCSVAKQYIMMFFAFTSSIMFMYQDTLFCIFAYIPPQPRFFKSILMPSFWPDHAVAVLPCMYDRCSMSLKAGSSHFFFSPQLISLAPVAQPEGHPQPSTGSSHSSLTTVINDAVRLRQLALCVMWVWMHVLSLYCLVE